MGVKGCFKGDLNFRFGALGLQECPQNNPCAGSGASRKRGLLGVANKYQGLEGSVRDIED